MSINNRLTAELPPTPTTPSGILKKPSPPSQTYKSCKLRCIMAVGFVVCLIVFPH